MGDEQEREIPAGVLAKLSVVERGDNRLTCSGGRHDEVPVAVVTLTFNGQRVKHSLLMGVGTHVKIGERDR